jgi:hypothetical protein
MLRGSRYAPARLRLLRLQGLLAHQRLLLQLPGLLSHVQHLLLLATPAW